MDESLNIKENSKQYLCMRSMVFLVLFIALIRKIDDFDIWYHLAIGREIWKLGSIPSVEFLTYGNLGEAVSFHEWGFALFYYKIHQWFGLPGMSLINALVGAGALFLCYLTAERRGRYNPPALLMLAGLFWLVRFRLVYRPEMFLFVALSSVIYLFERHSDKGDWRWLVPLPFIALVLTNCHPSTIILMILTALYLVQYLCDRKHDLATTFAKCLALFLALFAAAAINPYGFRQIFIPIEFTRNREFLGNILEFTPTLQTPYKWVFLCICMITLIVLLLQPKRRYVDWGILIFFAYMGYEYVRNIAIFALMVYVPLALGINALLQNRPWLMQKIYGKTVQWIAVFSFALILIPSILKPSWGYGIDPYLFPSRAAEKLLEIAPKGNLFNQLNAGGYLAWRLEPRYRVFTDGRHYGMDKSFISHNYVFMAQSGWDDILKSYNANIIISSATIAGMGKIIPLMDELARSQEWLLMEAGPGGLLFIRSSAIPRSYLASPLSKELVWRQVIEESRQCLKENPRHANSLYAMGIASLKLNDIPSAIDSMRRYLEVVPDDADVVQLVQGMGVPAGSGIK